MERVEVVLQINNKKKEEKQTTYVEYGFDPRSKKRRCK